MVRRADSGFRTGLDWFGLSMASSRSNGQCGRQRGDSNGAQRQSELLCVIIVLVIVCAHALLVLGVLLPTHPPHFFPPLGMCTFRFQGMLARLNELVEANMCFVSVPVPTVTT